MKLKFGFVALGAMFFLASCGEKKAADAGHEGHDHGAEAHSHEAETPAENTADVTIYTVNAAESSIKWTADKVFGKGHFGSVQLKEGSLEVAGDAITGGSFVADMSTIVSEDMEEGDYKTKLEAHLKGTAEKGTTDFFHTTEFPTASFEITNVADGNVTGNLTIRDHTEEVSFPATVTVEGNTVKANGTVEVDRTKFGITYNSQNFFKDVADDYLIKDVFTLEIDLTASNN